MTSTQDPEPDFFHIQADLYAQDEHEETPVHELLLVVVPLVVEVEPLPLDAPVHTSDDEGVLQ